jgi:primosomal protein DnaI
MQHIGQALNFARQNAGHSPYTPDYFREKLPQLRALGVDDQTIKQGAILLLDLLKQEKVCSNCTGFENCGKEGDAKGHYDLLDVYNDQLMVRTTHCTKFLNFVERREIDRLKEFSEKTQADRQFRFENFPLEQAQQHSKLFAAAMEFAESYKPGSTSLEDKSTYADKTPIKGIYMFGPPGVGKTHLMLAICNRLDERNVPNIFVRADTIFDKLRTSVGSGEEMETIIDKYCTVPVLAIDEFAQERANEFTLDKMFRIINYRFSNGLPTLFTSNYMPPEIYRTFRDSSRTVDAMISRIVQMARIGRLNGKDARLNHMELL